MADLIPQHNEIDPTQVGNYHDRSQLSNQQNLLSASLADFDRLQQQSISDYLANHMVHDYQGGLAFQTPPNVVQLPVSTNPMLLFPGTTYVTGTAQAFEYHDSLTQHPLSLEMHSTPEFTERAHFTDQVVHHMDHGLHVPPQSHAQMPSLDHNSGRLMLHQAPGHQQYNSVHPGNYSINPSQSPFHQAQPQANFASHYPNETATLLPSHQRSYTAPELPILDQSWLEQHDHMHRHNATEAVEMNHSHHFAPHLHPQHIVFTPHIQPQELYTGMLTSNTHVPVSAVYNYPSQQCEQVKQAQNTSISQSTQNRQPMRNLHRPRQQQRGRRRKVDPEPLSAEASPPPVTRRLSTEDAYSDSTFTESTPTSSASGGSGRKARKFNNKAQDAEGRERNRIAANKSRDKKTQRESALVARELELRTENESLRGAHDNLDPEWYSLRTQATDVANGCSCCRAKFMEYINGTKKEFSKAHRQPRNVDTEAAARDPICNFAGGTSRGQRASRAGPQQAPKSRKRRTDDAGL